MRILERQLYHATKLKNIPSIQNEGLRAGSFVTRLEFLAEYYAETIEDEGQKAVILVIDTQGLDFEFLPDSLGLEEPIASVLRNELGLNEKDIEPLWLSTNGSGSDCMKLIGSAICAKSIPPHAMSVGEVGEAGDAVALMDYRIECPFSLVSASNIA